MAYRTYSAKLQKDDAGITLIAAGAADSVLFTRTAYYAALGEGAHVLSFKRGISLGVDGQLVSANGSTVTGGAGIGISDIRVGATGAITSNGGIAVEVAGASLALFNRGEISGATGVASTASDSALTNAGAISGRTAVVFDTDRSSVDNSGEIVGGTFGVRIVGTNGGHQVTNTGLISAGQGTAVTINAAGSVLIANAGTISGRTAINLDSVDAIGERVILNTGTISGIGVAVYGSGVTDTLRNDGHIAGLVNLYGGDDEYDGSGGSAAGLVLGGDGNDVLTGGAGRDRFNGGGGDDLLAGGAGNDLLIAGAGNDYLDGGEGRDIVSYRDATAGMFLYLGEGSKQGDLTETFTSVEGLEGGSGSDVLTGSERGGEWLYGGAGTDSLNGGGGADVLYGGLGDDLYTAAGDGEESIDDRVIERAGEGIDTVLGYGSYTLPDNVERLVLQLYFDANGTGNALNNEIIGSLSSNRLDGKEGADTLTGRDGNDQFQFSTALGPTNIDTVTDFDAPGDKIYLSRTIFGDLPVSTMGELSSTVFRTGAQAGDADDRIIFNPANDALYFDPDGTGAAAQIQIAFIKGDDVLSSSIFVTF